MWRLGSGNDSSKDAGVAIDKLENPHTSSVARIEFSPVKTVAGYQFVTAGENGSSKLWRWSATGNGFQLHRDLTIPGVRCIDVRYLPDGSRLVMAGSDGRLRLVPIEKDRPPSRELRLPSGLSATCVSVSKSGRYIAAGASDHSAYLYDLQNGSQQPVAEMTGHADQIESIRIISDESGITRVVTASRDKSVRLWDPRLTSLTESEKRASRSEAFEILALRRHAAGVTAVEATEDATLLLTAGADGKVFVWPAPLARNVVDGADRR